MPHESMIVSPADEERMVLSSEGKKLQVPDDWALLPPGDAALSRRIKKDGPSWTVIEWRRRKKYSHGIWAPAERIDFLRKQLEEERADPSYQWKLEAGRKRRAKEQENYAGEFEQAILEFLSFSDEFQEMAVELAKRVTLHAIPVGSGTVARTKTIPVERRAEAAVIAWMRHQTTAYDEMTIPRARGERREVRRMLAGRSREILESYREGVEVDPGCPLKKALES
ncbi:MAG: DUF2293 domain-containing protein [Akkermansiaceae bacterium]